MKNLIPEVPFFAMFEILNTTQMSKMPIFYVIAIFCHNLTSGPFRTGSVDHLAEEVNEQDTDFNDTIIINVGGQCHEILRSTLQAQQVDKLSNKEELLLHFRKHKNDYYFDRHPIVFIAILNYLRTGELHAPIDVCGAVFRQELKYWGIDELKLQQCCWIRYCSDLDTQNILKRFEIASNTIPVSNEKVHRWEKFRSKVWDVLDKPHSCTAAKIYAGFSLLLVLLSIGIFCAASHPSLIANATAEHYAEYFGKHPSEFSDDGYMFMPADYESYNDYNSENGSTSTDSMSNDTRVKRGISDETYKDENVNVKSIHKRSMRNMNRPTISPKESNKKKIEININPPNDTLELINMICVIFFTIEIVLRFIFCPQKLKYFISALNIIDICAILPFYIELIVHCIQKAEKYQQSIVDVLFLLQILRIVRIFRLIRHVKGLRVLVFTLKHSWKEMLLMLIFLIIGMLIFGSLIYFTEYNSGGKILSIPHGFWWAMVTMTTVGYGDMYPSTNWGYVVGSFCTITGVLVIAFSVPSLVNNFMLFYSYVQYEKKERSVSCGDKKRASLRLSRKITPKDIKAEIKQVTTVETEKEQANNTKK